MPAKRISQNRPRRTCQRGPYKICIQEPPKRIPERLSYINAGHRPDLHARTCNTWHLQDLHDSSCKDLLDRIPHIPQGALQSLQDFTRSSHKDLRKITRGLLKSGGFRQDLHKILFPARTSTNPWSRSKFLRTHYGTLAVIEGPFRELRRSVWRDL